MNNSSQISDSGDKSHYETSAFTRELIDEVAHSHFSINAWRTLLSRSWARSLNDIRESSARARSCWSWIAGVAATGIGIVSLTLFLQSPDRALTALMYWIPWYASAAFFLLTHLGMVDDGQGHPRSSLLLPNGLSFLRLSLAPLVVWPCLQIPVNPTTGAVFAALVLGLSSTDLLDGWLARRRKLCTRLGHMLDPLADLALLTFLALGLYLVGAIPATLLLLLFVRYPVSFVGVLIIYFVRGPVPLRPTFIGKATTFVTSIVLLAIALKTLLPVSWPSPQVIEWSIRLLYFLITINILYLINRATTWSRMFNEAH